MRCTVLCILPAFLAFAQTTPPVFEVASVKIRQQPGQDETVATSPGILTMRNVSCTTALKWASQLQAPQISGQVVEGLNNKATMRKSYGLRTYRVLELALYHSLGKLPEPELAHDFF